MDGTYANAPGGDWGAAETSLAYGTQQPEHSPAQYCEQVVDLWSELIRAQADHRTDEKLRCFGVASPDARAYCGLARIQTNGKFYEPHDAGEYAVIVPIMDGDELCDLIAFDPRKPDKWFVRLGGEPLLGSGALSEQLLGKPLHVFKTPLTWLQAGCDGVVVLDINRAFIDLKRTPNHIVPEDAEHGRQLRQAMLQAATWGLPRMLIRDAP